MKDITLENLRTSMEYARSELSDEDFDRALYIANRMYFAQKNGKKHFLNSLGQSNGKTIAFAIMMKEHWVMMESSYDRAYDRARKLDNLYKQDSNIPVSAARLLDEHNIDSDNLAPISNKHFVLQYLLDEDIADEYTERNTINKPKNFTVKQKALGSLFDSAKVLGWEEDVLDVKNWKPDNMYLKYKLRTLHEEVSWKNPTEYENIKADVKCFEPIFDTFKDIANRRVNEKISDLSDIEERDCLIIPKDDGYLVWEAVNIPTPSIRYADELIGKAWEGISKKVHKEDNPFTGNSKTHISNLIKTVKMLQRVKRHLKTGFLVRNIRYKPNNLGGYTAERGVDLIEFLDSNEENSTKCSYSIPDLWIRYIDDEYDASMYISSAETSAELLNKIIDGGVEELSEFPEPIEDANDQKDREVIHIDTCYKWNQGKSENWDEGQGKDLWLVRTILEDEDRDHGTISYPKHGEELPFDDFLNIHNCQGSNEFKDKNIVQVGGLTNPNPTALLKYYLVLFQSFDIFSFDRENYNRFNIKGLNYPTKIENFRLVGSSDDDLDLIHEKVVRRKLRDVFYRLRQDGKIIYHGPWLDILDREFNREEKTLGKFVVERKDVDWILDNQDMIRDEVKQQIAEETELYYTKSELFLKRKLAFKYWLEDELDSDLEDSVFQDYPLSVSGINEKFSNESTVNSSTRSVRRWLKDFEDNSDFKINKRSGNLSIMPSEVLES